MYSLLLYGDRHLNVIENRSILGNQPLNSCMVLVVSLAMCDPACKNISVAPANISSIFRHIPTCLHETSP